MDNRLVIRLTKSVGNIASLFTLPSIGALYTEILETEKKSFSTYLYKIIDFLKIGFPVYADHMAESMANDIGEQTLVSAMGTDAGTLQRLPIISFHSQECGLCMDISAILTIICLQVLVIVRL